MRGKVAMEEHFVTPELEGATFGSTGRDTQQVLEDVMAAAPAGARR